MHAQRGIERGLEILAGEVGHLHPDRDQPVVKRHLRQSGIKIAHRGDAQGLGDGGGRRGGR